MTQALKPKTEVTISPELLEAPHWTEQEKANAHLIAEFIQLLMNDHNFEAVRQNYSGYRIQHSRGIPEGVEGLVKYVSDFAKRFPEYSYDVKRIMVDGDLVTFHSHATIKAADRGNDKKGFNIIDTWRIQDGEIAEHWDAIQPLDTFMRLYVAVVGGRIQNTNGVF